MSKNNQEVVIGLCTLWPGLRDKDGYGVVKIQGKMKKAHRVAMEILIGRRLDASEKVLHLCDVPSCYNKKHLMVGTTALNNQMKRDKQITIADRLLTGWEKIYGNGVVKF